MMFFKHHLKVKKSIVQTNKKQIQTLNHLY